ncbi:MAG: hypothetical protein COV76_02550 [Candidatus Omnitrophica bacterium CG11_big_fil_rev_8_21_14_0_20_64_10]|nr:MAG: hypothetical protein COV76_02550 [Candidatus Omnitrophica bacterium CG11_big_fil_rev_8_21_14_0_20_64_10]
MPAGLMVLAAIGLAAWAWLAGDDSPTRAASAAGAGTPESPRLFSLRSAESAWRLSGVIESRKGRSLALINGKWIEEGQTTADGARVVRVEKRQVALERDGALETVTLR